MIAQTNIDSTNSAFSIKDKIKDYVQLFKLRLTALVVFSTFMGFIIGADSDTNWLNLFPLLIGGFLTVAASNSLNQIIERKSDRLMTRTLNRPVATNRMSISEALIASILTGIAGVYLLGMYLNELSALLATIGLVIYAFLYTPLKKISPISVWIGAISGAIPPLVGIAAVTGSLNEIAWVIFTLQFFWQFPHFYAIAWVFDDDYKRAGLKLMPIGGKKNRVSTYQIFFLTAILIPTAIIPYFLGFYGILSSGVCVAAGIYLLLKSIKLISDSSDVNAKKLMFASFIYLPIMLLGIALDSLI